MVDGLTQSAGDDYGGAHRSSLSTLALRNFPHQIVFIREFTRRMLRVNPGTVYAHVEDTTAFGNEGCLGAKSVSQLSSQTDRSGFVVSLRAVSDRNIHVSSPVGLVMPACPDAGEPTTFCMVM